MKTTVATILATLGSAVAFSPAALNVRVNTQVFSDAVIEEAAPVPVEEPEPVPEPEPVSLGFCRGYVGGEGPEPMPFTAGLTSINFDPVGFTERAPEWVPWFREAELKHGRAAMLATVGFVIPEFMRVPGEQFSFESVPSVMDAYNALPGSMGQIVLFISVIEAMTIPALANMNGYDRMPGDYSFDPLGLFPKSPEKQAERQLNELKNGRLAMIAIGGMVTGSAITGSGFPYL